MASWCWEAANALAEIGEEVTLVCAPGLDLPKVSNVNIVTFLPPESVSRKNKILREFERLSAKTSGFVYHLHHHLQHTGLMPSVYVLNQSDLLDTRIDVPQHVVAWGLSNNSCWLS